MWAHAFVKNVNSRAYSIIHPTKEFFLQSDPDSDIHLALFVVCAMAFTLLLTINARNHLQKVTSRVDFTLIVDPTQAVSLTWPSWTILAWPPFRRWTRWKEMTSLLFHQVGEGVAPNIFITQVQALGHLWNPHHSVKVVVWTHLTLLLVEKAVKVGGGRTRGEQSPEKEMQ